MTKIYKIVGGDNDGLKVTKETFLKYFIVGYSEQEKPDFFNELLKKGAVIETEEEKTKLSVVLSDFNLRAGYGRDA